MRRLLLGTSLLVAVAAAPACVSNNEDGGMLILEAVAPQSGCVVSPTLGEMGITHGQMSSLVPTEYVLIAQVQSRITAEAGQEANRTVVMNGANIDLTFPNSTLFTSAELADMKSKGITHFKSLFSAPLQPNAALTDASFAITPRALYDSIYAKAPQARNVPTDMGMEFALEVKATITITGKMDGADVTSQPFEFPVGISNTNGVVTIAGTCPLDAGTTVATGNNCGQAQDAPITCCTMGSSVICPATVAPAGP